MRLWYQLLSSEKRLSNFIGASGRLCARAAAPGTTVEVHGTRHGALGDQYRFFWHYDVREVIENGLAVRGSKAYDAFVIANSLDPALVELREMLDIPVLSFMEVCCFTACMMGERFGLVVPNEKMIPRYREIVHGYGLAARLAAVEPLGNCTTRSSRRAGAPSRGAPKCSSSPARRAHSWRSAASSRSSARPCWIATACSSSPRRRWWPCIA
jgi:hypothetical protein